MVVMTGTLGMWRPASYRFVRTGWRGRVSKGLNLGMEKGKQSGRLR